MMRTITMSTNKKSRKNYKKNCIAALVCGVAIYAMSDPACASSLSSSGAGLPWEDTMNTIVSSVQGPIVRAIAIVSLIGAGAGLAFGEHGSGAKKLAGWALGISLILGITTVVSTLFGATF